MAFGPESTNPRERRAYAHTMISKLALGEVSYGDALQAAWKAHNTAKGSELRSGLGAALMNASNKVILPKEQGASAHRKIRRVPLGWQHPKNEAGLFIPLHDTREGGGRYSFSEIDWMLQKGQIKSVEQLTSRFMPTFHDVPEEEMGICLYSITTEGVPVTPVFPDTDEGQHDLAAYAAEYATRFGDDRMSAREWHARFFGENEQLAA